MLGSSLSIGQKRMRSPSPGPIQTVGHSVVQRQSNLRATSADQSTPSAVCWPSRLQYTTAHSSAPTNLQQILALHSASVGLSSAPNQAHSSSTSADLNVVHQQSIRKPTSADQTTTTASAFSSRLQATAAAAAAAPQAPSRSRAQRPGLYQKLDNLVIGMKCRTYSRVTRKDIFLFLDKTDNEYRPLMSFDLTDETTSVRVVCFKRDNIEKHSPNIRNGDVIDLSSVWVNATVQTHIGAAYEIQMQFLSRVKVLQGHNDTPVKNFRFMDFNEIQALQAGCSVDVVGIVEAVNDLDVRMSNETEETLDYRAIVLKNEHDEYLEVATWATTASEWGHETNTVLGFYNVKTYEYGGERTVSLGSYAEIMDDPPTLKAVALHDYIIRHK